jgi:hypothetical protein
MIIQDFYNYIGIAAITVSGAVLIAINLKDDTARCAKWLKYGAIPLELLGLALSVFWAVTAPQGTILPLIFVFGFVGMLAGRSVLIPLLARAWSVQDYRKTIWIFSALFTAYFVLYLSGGFHGMNSASNEANARLEASKPAQALDAEITTIQGRIGELAGFADAGKAHNEELAVQQAMQQAQAEKTALQSELAKQNTKLSSCPRNYKTKCINPAKAEISRITALLDNLPVSTAGSGYAQRNSEYTGLKMHLVELQKQRAAMSANGQGMQDAWKAEDIAISQWFGISPAQASRMKWLIAVFFFDFISLMFRFVAAMVAPQDQQAEERRKLNALLNAGLPLQQAAAMLVIPTPQIAEITAKSNEGIGFMAGHNTQQGRKKGDICNCTECGASYTAKHKNHARCTDCSTQARQSYAKQKAGK